MDCLMNYWEELQPGHPTCMQYSKELTVRVREEAWQCMECKKCNICEQQGEAANLLFCDACDKGYHMECPLDDMPIGSWICEICVNERNGKRRRPSQSVVPASLLHSPDSLDGKGGTKQKYDDETRGCTTPGCDGKGHSTGKHDHHRSVQFCPLVNKKEKSTEEDGKDSTTARLPGVAAQLQDVMEKDIQPENMIITAEFSSQESSKPIENELMSVEIMRNETDEVDVCLSPIEIEMPNDFSEPSFEMTPNDFSEPSFEMTVDFNSFSKALHGSRCSSPVEVNIGQQKAAEIRPCNIMLVDIAKGVAPVKAKKRRKRFAKPWSARATEVIRSKARAPGKRAIMYKIKEDGVL